MQSGFRTHGITYGALLCLCATFLFAILVLVLAFAAASPAHAASVSIRTPDGAHAAHRALQVGSSASFTAEATGGSVKSWSWTLGREGCVSLEGAAKKDVAVTALKQGYVRITCTGPSPTAPRRAT